MAPPLAGVRVADFSRVIAGPISAMTLADLGADVVKIEHPQGGDDTRGYKPPDYHGLAPAFLCYNRNKRSIALDLAVAEGAAVARALIDRADVVIENFSTGVMAKYGLDWETVAKGRDDLIYCSTSAYGRTGPFKSRAGYDPVVQAESGFMSVTGLETREPIRTGMPMIDISTGLTAAQAVLAALFHRRRTGKGQFIEVPLFDTGFSVTSIFSTSYMIDGTVADRKGNGDQFVHPVGQYRASDGDLMLSVPDDRRFEALCRDVLERPDLLEDGRFAGNAARLAHRATLDATLAEVFQTAPVMHWVERARAAGVAMGPVRSIEQAMSAPVVAARGLARRATHQDFGDAPNIASPIRLDRTPVREPSGAPLLGRHTEEVLGEWLGRSPEEVRALRTAGAIPAMEG